MLTGIYFAVVIILIVIAILLTAAVADAVDKNRKDIKTLRIRQEFLKIKIDAYEDTINRQNIQIAALASKNEDMKVQLSDLSNKYTVAKRNIESLTGTAVRGGGVKWNRENKSDESNN